VSVPGVVVHRDAELLARAAAARLVTRLVDAQAATGQASVVLTGGGILEATLAAVAEQPARDAVDWRRLDVWWGDERFLPAGHAERNETPARAVLLDHVDVAADRVHPMPASDGLDGDDPDAAAARYAAELGAGEARSGPLPPFDVVLLGMGPDGHVASLFPGMPGLDDERPVVAVRRAPKPPPTRLSLTLAAIGTATEVWVVVAGEAKAEATRLALSGAPVEQIPAAGARGRQRTLWLLDQDAASRLG
jgi:6-phosphogluconolactonase